MQVGSDAANVLINICSVFETFSLNCFVMKDFWEQLSKRIGFTIFIEFDIYPAKKIKACAVCKRLFLDEWSIKKVVELPPDSLLSFEFIVSFWGDCFLNRINFRFTNTNVIFLLQSFYKIYIVESPFELNSVKISLAIYNFYYNLAIIRIGAIL